MTPVTVHFYRQHPDDRTGQIDLNLPAVPRKGETLSVSFTDAEEGLVSNAFVVIDVTHGVEVGGKGETVRTEIVLDVEVLNPLTQVLLVEEFIRG